MSTRFLQLRKKYISKRINEIALIDYVPLDFSKIYFKFSDFTETKEKLTFKKKHEQKKQK